MTARLVRTLPAFAPRPAFERTDVVIDPVSSLAFVPGTTDVITIGRFGLQRFALDRDEPVWSVAADGRWRTAIALSPDGARLLTIGDDDLLVERDPSTGLVRRGAARLFFTTSLVFSADGHDVLWAGSSVPGNPSGYSASAVDLWDATTLERRWRWAGPDWRSAAGAAFTPRGILVAHWGQLLVRLDRKTGGIVKKLNQTASTLHGAGDERTTIACKDAVLRVRRDGRLLGTLELEADICAIDPRARFAAVAQEWYSAVEIVAFDPVRITASLAFPADDRELVTGLACAERHVAIGTNGGHTYVYELT